MRYHLFFNSFGKVTKLYTSYWRPKTYGGPCSNHPVPLSEIIDLSCSGYHRCPDWVDFPSDAYGATGGLLEGVPIICGGYSNYQYFDECYKVTANKVYFFVTMSTKRYGAASVIIDHPTLHYGRL